MDSDRKRKQQDTTPTADKDSKNSTTNTSSTTDHNHKKPKSSKSSNGTSNREHGVRKTPSSNPTAVTKVRAFHILIKHQGSRRKASWRDPEGAVIAKRTRDDAVAQMKAIREDIVSGKVKFEDVASRVSDCNSAKRGGDLGSFSRGQMQKPFEEATFALRIGEISEIVDTDSGVHIIKRTG